MELASAVGQGRGESRERVRLATCEVEPLGDTWADVRVSGIVASRGFEAVVRLRASEGAWSLAHVVSWAACPDVARFSTEKNHQELVARRVALGMARWAQEPENAALLLVAGQRARRRRSLALEEACRNTERELAAAEATVATLRSRLAAAREALGPGGEVAGEAVPMAADARRAGTLRRG